MPKILLTLFFSLLMIDSALAVDKVSLNYGWKPGIYVKVNGYQSQEKMLGEQSSGKMRVDMSYIMGTQAHGEGLRVDFMDVKTSIAAEEQPLQEWMKNYLEAISGSLPSYVINAQGEMVGAIGLSKFRETMVGSIASALQEAPAPQRQQIMAGLEQVFSEESLNYQLASDWGLYVGQWLGAELEDDGIYELEFETPIPALGNQVVKSIAQIEFAGRVNCDSNDQSQRCVTLLYRSQTDDVSVDELLRKIMPAGEPVPDMNFSVELDLELVTDPDNLLTYNIRQTKRTSSPIETANGLVTATQVEESEYKFLYVLGNESQVN